MNGCYWDTFKTGEITAIGSWDTSEEFTQVRFGFVQRSFAIFVTDADLSSVCHKILGKRKAEWCHWHFLIGYPVGNRQMRLCFSASRVCTNLSHLVLAPEAGIMQWCVSVLIGSICVCFALDQLKERETKDYEQHKAGQILFGLYTVITANAAKKNHECVLPVDTYQRYWDMTNIKLNSCLAAILNQTPCSRSLPHNTATLLCKTLTSRLTLYVCHGLISISFNKYNYRASLRVAPFNQLEALYIYIKFTSTWTYTCQAVYCISRSKLITKL